MRPLLQHASRSVFANAAIIAPRQTARTFSYLPKSAVNAPSVCPQCRFRASVAFSQRTSYPSKSIRRRLHQTPNEERKPLDEKAPPTEPKSVPEANETASAEASTAPSREKVVDDIARVPAEDLPSHKAAQRWDFSKKLTELMDELLPKLAVVTQKVNTYTGTDYSGIEALRREIQEQEKLVKARRAAIEEAKHALDAAHAQQASSQKEVVALLERKHSWSATDLERYMSLIRSEHVNDQAVREAKEAVGVAENALEEGRAQLERRERAQYHEEQIWSDTIRRNSTWVTFGLMGVNIFLLLLSLVALEPWRRRRMVREIKTALEAQKAASEPTMAAGSRPISSAAAIEVIEAEIDKAIDAAEAFAESSSHPETASNPAVVAEHTTTAQVAALDSAVEPGTPGAAPLTTGEVSPQETINIDEEVKSSTKLRSLKDKITFIAQDVISERIISLRRIDYTTAMLQSAAAGAVISAAIIAMVIRPR